MYWGLVWRLITWVWGNLDPKDWKKSFEELFLWHLLLFFHEVWEVDGSRRVFLQEGEKLFWIVYLPIGSWEFIGVPAFLGWTFNFFQDPSLVVGRQKWVVCLWRTHAVSFWGGDEHRHSQKLKWFYNIEKLNHSIKGGHILQLALAVSCQNHIIWWIFFEHSLFSIE